MAGWVIYILAVMLASSFALRLPALVVGDAEFTRTFALIQGRRMWPGLPLGLVLSLAPYVVASWILNSALQGFASPVPHAAKGAPVNFTPLLTMQKRQA